ncbi:MAG: hypothetical protein JSW61_01815, partial [Candidatus Thorarchaeota archaeon]
ASDTLHQTTSLTRTQHNIPPKTAVHISDITINLYSSENSVLSKTLESDSVATEHAFVYATIS